MASGLTITELTKVTGHEYNHLQRGAPSLKLASSERTSTLRWYTTGDVGRFPGGVGSGAVRAPSNDALHRSRLLCPGFVLFASGGGPMRFIRSAVLHHSK